MCRYELANYSSEQLHDAGTELHLLGHIIGSDRVYGASPLGHGNDEAAAVSVLLLVASQLTSSSQACLQMVANTPPQRSCASW